MTWVRLDGVVITAITMMCCATATPVVAAASDGQATVACAGPFGVEEPGGLPAAGATELAGVPLPEGHGDKDGGFWITDERVPDAADLWAQLAVQFNETGLWPMLLWESTYDISPTVPPVEGESDAESILGRWWDAAIEQLGDEAAERTDPIGTSFPGLTPRQTSCMYDVFAPSPGTQPPYFVALVPVARPADVIAALAWRGSEPTTAVTPDLVTVLRSWEERVGVYPLVAEPGESVAFVVQAPPDDRDQRLLWEAERFAVAPSQFPSNLSLGEWVETTDPANWLSLE